MGGGHKAIHKTAAALLHRAQHAKAVRAELDASDLLILANGIALTGADATHAAHLLDLVRYGAVLSPER